MPNPTECPACKLINPPGAERCDCGFDLSLARSSSASRYASRGRKMNALQRFFRRIRKNAAFSEGNVLPDLPPAHWQPREVFISESGGDKPLELSPRDITHSILILDEAPLGATDDELIWGLRQMLPEVEPEMINALNAAELGCAGSAGTGERALRVSVDAALRAGFFKASGSFDPMGFWDERER